MSSTDVMAPVAKTVHVRCPVDRAFTVFTREIASWWPTETHSLHPGRVEQVVWEETEGGDVYEIAADGERSQWGTVLRWEPPRCFVLAWQVNPDRLGTEIEVRFSPDGDGTRVDLEHRGWEHVVDGAEMRARYDTGWDHVLGRLVERAA